MTETRDIAAIQRHTLRVLTAGQVVGSAALSAAVTVGAFVIQDILGQETPLGGMATATVTVGTAFMAQWLARLMSVRGRRRGLALGYGLALIGGLIAGVGVETSTLSVFMVGLFLFGNGQASNLLARYAATDLAEVEHRGKAMSRVLFASTFGAVCGPILIKPAERAGEVLFGWKLYTGPWVFSGLFFAFSLVNVWIRLRPDPLEVAGLLGSAEGPKRSFSDVLVPLRHSRTSRLALFAMVLSQMTMVAVMTMTPVHLKIHGHESVSAFIVSLHVAGMYAFSPLIGRFSDTYGRSRAIQVGALVLIVASAFSSLAGDSPTLLWPGLLLLGIGWNFGIVGGSGMLSESIPTEIRVRVQGSADLLMSLCGGIAGFSSGFIRKAIGYNSLAVVGMVLTGILLAISLGSSERVES
ncbi:MAG: MFS transporter [Ilumatobacteraceae bacterium]